MPYAIAKERTVREVRLEEISSSDRTSYSLGAQIEA